MYWLIIPVAVYSALIVILWLIVQRRSDVIRHAPGALQSVTVVVAAKNEEKNIETLLECLARQDYPPELLEIVIVNDNSTDRTPVAVSEFIARQEPGAGPAMRLIYNPYSGKKRALRHGIEKSSGEIIITTDADCKVGPGWVSAHAEAYCPPEESVHTGASESLGENAHAANYNHSGEAPPAASGKFLERDFHDVADVPVKENIVGETGGPGSADMIAGEVYQRPVKGFFALFGVFEFSALQSVTEAAVRAGHPVMCNGANMSFKREVWLRHAGELRYELPSGDDMFMLHAVSRAGGRVGYAASEAAAAETAAAVTAAALLRQRARWASKTFHYSDGATLTLAAATAACNAAVAAAAVASAISAVYLPLLAAMYALRLVPDYLIITRNIKKRSGKMPLVPFILSELIYPFYFMTVAAVSLFPSSRRFGKR